MLLYLAFLSVPAALLAQVDLGRVLPADRPLHIVAFGDFGSGEPGQLEVAHAIARRHAQYPFTFAAQFYDPDLRTLEKNSLLRQRK